MKKHLEKNPSAFLYKVITRKGENDYEAIRTGFNQKQEN